jgi:hypothetical protein
MQESYRRDSQGLVRVIKRHGCNSARGKPVNSCAFFQPLLVWYKYHRQVVLTRALVALMHLNSLSPL